MKDWTPHPLGGDVSRETLARFATYKNLLRRWNQRINLVSPNTLDDMESRHFADSAQIARHLQLSGNWADFGAGAGFPGLVIAILAAEKGTQFTMTLIESDKRKSAFLREVVRATDAPATVRNSRIENVNDILFDVICARALAPLPKLLDLSFPRLAPNATCVFLKGQNAPSEIENARKNWRFSSSSRPSVTQPDGEILILKDIARA